MRSPRIDQLQRLADIAATSGRWTADRKAAVLDLIGAGDLTTEQACINYDLSAEELASWSQRSADHGLKGLKVTKLQQVGR